MVYASGRDRTRRTGGAQRRPRCSQLLGSWTASGTAPGGGYDPALAFYGSTILNCSAPKSIIGSGKIENSANELSCDPDFEVPDGSLPLMACGQNCVLRVGPSPILKLSAGSVKNIRGRGRRSASQCCNSRWLIARCACGPTTCGTELRGDCTRAVWDADHRHGRLPLLRTVPVQERNAAALAELFGTQSQNAR